MKQPRSNTNGNITRPVPLNHKVGGVRGKIWTTTTLLKIAILNFSKAYRVRHMSYGDEPSYPDMCFYPKNLFLIILWIFHSKKIFDSFFEKLNFFFQKNVGRPAAGQPISKWKTSAGRPTQKNIKKAR